MRDALLLLSDEQDIGVSAASTNKIPVPGAANIGAGEPMFIQFTVKTAFTAAGAATLTPSVRTDDNAGFTSPSTLLTGPAIPKATLVAGYMFALPIPAQGYEDYMDVYFTVATGPFTAGTLDAALVHDLQTNV